MGATPVSVTIPYRGVQNVEPARPLAVAMKNADLCLTVGPYESADYYTKASLEMLESGTRVLGWQSITAENLIQYVYFHDFTVTDVKVFNRSQSMNAVVSVSRNFPGT